MTEIVAKIINSDLIMVYTFQNILLNLELILILKPQTLIIHSQISFIAIINPVAKSAINIVLKNLLIFIIQPLAKYLKKIKNSL